MKLSEVSPGDTVRVTVYRHYGEEQECADYWDAEVQAIDTETGRINVPGNHWVDVRGLNPNGVDPSHTTTRARVRKSTHVTGPFQSVFFDGETPALEEFRDRALEQSWLLVNANKAERKKLAKELAQTIRSMDAEARDI